MPELDVVFPIASPQVRQTMQHGVRHLAEAFVTRLGGTPFDVVYSTP